MRTPTSVAPLAVGLSTCTYHMLLKCLRLTMLLSSPKTSFASRGFSSWNSPNQTRKVTISFNPDPIESCWLFIWSVLCVKGALSRAGQSGRDKEQIPWRGPHLMKGKRHREMIRQQQRPCVMRSHCKAIGMTSFDWSKPEMLPVRGFKWALGAMRAELRGEEREGSMAFPVGREEKKNVWVLLPDIRSPPEGRQGETGREIVEVQKGMLYSMGLAQGTEKKHTRTNVQNLDFLSLLF